MEGQGFSKEPALGKDSFGEAKRIRRYGLNALKRIEKESKKNPQTGHPISFLGVVAGDPNILQFLYDNHQGLALEHDGTRATYYVIKDSEDPEHKRLIIQGLGFAKGNNNANLDVEWLEKYGDSYQQGCIKKLAKLTRQDVIRSVRRAIIERYDPNKYKNKSLFGAVHLGINKIAEGSGVRAVGGAVADTIADTVDDRNYRIHKKREGETPSDKLRRERRKGVKKRAALAVGTALVAGAIVGVGIYDYQHKGITRKVVDKPIGIVEEKIQGVVDKPIGIVVEKIQGVVDKSMRIVEEKIQGDGG